MPYLLDLDSSTTALQRDQDVAASSRIEARVPAAVREAAPSIAHPTGTPASTVRRADASRRLCTEGQSRTRVPLGRADAGVGDHQLYPGQTPDLQPGIGAVKKRPMTVAEVYDCLRANLFRTHEPFRSPDTLPQVKRCDLRTLKSQLSG